MDSDDVVRRITAEVLRRLMAEGAAPSPTPPPAPARSATVASPSAPTAAARPAAGCRALVLLTGGDRELDAVLAQVGAIAEAGAATTIVMSPTAERVIGLPAVRRVAPGARVLQSGEAVDILQGVEAVYLPNLSLNAASKIGRLVPDSLVCILAIRSLMLGLPVAASAESLIPQGIDPARVPEGVRARVDELLAGLRAMGMRVCPLGRLASGPATGVGPSGCSLSAGGECSACGLCVEQHPQAVAALVSSGAERLAAAPGAKPASADMARLIDHTLLKPDATEEQVRKLCQEAREYSFASVCVNPAWVKLCAGLLAGSPVKVCTVIGFPLGATTATAKAVETRDAIANGATEIDMVINVGALKSGDDDVVRRDIEAVVAAARGSAIVKTILETALLTREEKIKACLLAKMAGADFVKTSTGFGPGGATVEDIALMRQTVGPEMGVKASGGIRDRKTADAMVAAGASRIGASASVAIATAAAGGGKGY